MPGTPPLAPNFDALTDRCVRTLSRLIRFNTANPPGDEVECARWVAEQLGGAGLRCQIFEPLPRRGSAVARLPAQAPGGARRRPLLLLSHIDVVPADPAEWSRDPFGGEVADGQVWGRGALDMKHIVAIWMTLAAAVRETGLPTVRDIIVAATADEEAGGTHGVGWLAEHHWDLLDSEAALNEGGGHGVDVNGRIYYTLQTSEKIACRFRLVARGTPGHGSIPIADNAVLHLAQAVAALGTARFPIRLTETVRGFIAGIGAGLPAGKRERLERALRSAQLDAELDAMLDELVPDPFQRAELSSMMRNSLVPTVLQGSGRVNVIPSKAEAFLDCRILPGETAAGIRAQAESVLRGARLLDKVELEVVPRNSQPESPPHGPLVDAIHAAMKRHAPQARVLPYLMTGATDARFLRPRGVPVYGFVPVLPSVDPRTVHGIDERISIESLHFALRVLWDVLVAYCT